MERRPIRSRAAAPPVVLANDQLARVAGGDDDAEANAEPAKLKS
ncbi:MAG TPA: hypothetical protein VHT91_20720 [Kofleriaceae bacterium]|jgi:hypothetical protein|nr:hypothetical protein [Kofleriaceae bacterium]